MLAGRCYHCQERAACDRISHRSCVRLPGHAEAGGGHQPIRRGNHGLLLSLHVRPAGGTPLPLRIFPGPVHQCCGHAGTGMGWTRGGGVVQLLHQLLHDSCVSVSRGASLHCLACLLLLCQPRLTLQDSHTTGQ